VADGTPKVRVCAKCGQERPSKGKCPTCRKASNAAWWARNPKYLVAYYTANREKWRSPKLLALPGVTSAVTALVRKLTDSSGLSPRAVVYGVALLLTGAIVATGGGSAFPIAGADPTVTVGAWLTWAGATGALAEAVYRTLQPILAPA